MRHRKIKTIDTDNGQINILQDKEVKMTVTFDKDLSLTERDIVNGEYIIYIQLLANSELVEEDYDEDEDGELGDGRFDPQF